MHPSWAQLGHKSVGPLLNDLIRPLQQRRRDRQPEGLRGLEVDNEVEPVKLFDGKIPGVGAHQNLVDVPG